MILAKMLLRIWSTVIVIGPSVITPAEDASFSSGPLQNIALVIMDKYNKARQQDSRCTRVNWDLFCLLATESHMWSSNMEVLKLAPKSPPSSVPETRRHLSMRLSPLSQSNHLLHVNTVLQKHVNTKYRLCKCFFFYFRKTQSVTFSRVLEQTLQFCGLRICFGSLAYILCNVIF